VRRWILNAALSRVLTMNGLARTTGVAAAAEVFDARETF
jgi:hypothetical protein